MRDGSRRVLAGDLSCADTDRVTVREAAPPRRAPHPFGSNLPTCHHA
jgi:hypothetical protein